MAQTNTLPRLLTAVAVIALFVVTAIPAAEAQPPPDVCIGSLLKCTSSLNLTKPLPECCTAIKETVEKQRPCLCSLLNNPQVLGTANLTTEQALRIPQSCGLKADPSMCKAASAPLPASPVPTTETPSSDKGAAARIAGTGLTGLLFISISIMFN